MPASSTAPADAGAPPEATGAVSDAEDAARGSAGATQKPADALQREGVSALMARAARGGALLGIGQGLATAFGWAQTAILARLLVPEDFGLVGMATVVLGLFNVFANLGLSEALVARKDLEDAHKDAAFWSTLAMGALLFGISSALAPLVAAFYREPRLTWVVVAAAASLLTGPLYVTHSALLRRRMEFGKVARIELSRTVVSGVVAIVAALAGLRHWSLIVSTFGSHLTGFLLYRAADQSWRARTRGTRRHARQLLNFSLYVASAGTINYFSANIDYAVVGRALGGAVLGVYKLAYETMTFPLIRVSGLVGAVMFPAFAALQDRLPEMREAYLKISRTLALIGFPVLAWIAVTAPELIALVYGERWLTVVPLLRILSVAGAVKCVGTVVGLVYRTRGRVHVEFYWNIAWAIGLGAGILVGVHLDGVRGVAIAISALCVPGVLLTEWLACKYLEMPLRHLLRVLAAPALATGASTAAGWALRDPLAALPPGGLWLAVRLVALTLAMAVVYFGALRVLYPPIKDDLRVVVRYFRGKR